MDEKSWTGKTSLQHTGAQLVKRKRAMLESNPPRNSQGSQREFVFKGTSQGPADHTARIGVQDHGQVHKLVTQPDVSATFWPTSIVRKCQPISIYPDTGSMR